MKIRNAEFVKGCRKVTELPGDLPEVAFCGRSNVGKSSLLNTLTGKKGLARVSKTPGRTQQMNLFLCNDSFYLVDLPGFGYAKVSKHKKNQLGTMITAYVQQSPSLNGMVFLLDIRHKPSIHDEIMAEFLVEEEVPTLFVATKADKVGSSKRHAHLKTIRQTLHLPSDLPILPISTLKGQGIRELTQAIEEHFLKEPEP